MIAGASLYLAVLGLLLAYCVYTKIEAVLRERKFAREHGCKKPRRAPQKDPFFGFDIFLETVKAVEERRFLEYVHKRLENFGPTFTSNLMGDDMIFTNEPKNIQAMLATSFPDFDIGERRRKHSKHFWGIGIFNSDGPFWQHSRALVRPNFTRTQVADLSIFDKHVSSMLEQLPRDGSVIDLQEFFFRLTLDTSTEFLFGQSAGCLRVDATEASRKFALAFDTSLDAIGKKLRMGRFGWLQPRHQKACDYVHKFVEPIIAQAIARRQVLTATEKLAATERQQEERYTFLSQVVKETNNLEDIRGHMLNVLVAGRDTTAGLMSSLLFVLVHRQDLFSKLRTEIAMLRGRKPTYEDIKEMKYLDSLVKETLRLYPPTPINQRIANKDTLLPLGGGPDGRSPLYVCKHRIIIYEVYSLHRRTDIWGPDANEFRPERWASARPVFEYLPFNAGPRICPGQQFSLIETAYTIIRLCQAFDGIEARDAGGPWTEAVSITCAVGQGVKVTLT